MAERNRTIEITGNDEKTISIDDTYLSVYVRDIEWEEKPSSGIVYVEYLDANGSWNGFRSGVIDLSSTNPPPSPMVTDEVMKSVRVRTEGLPIDANVIVKFLFAGVASGGIDYRAYTDNTEFTRLRVQNLTLGQQFVVEGFGYEWWWRYRNASTNSRVFAKFTVPSGWYMALDNRLFQIGEGEAYYRVYRPADVDQDNETIGAELPIKSNLRNDALISTPTVATLVTFETNPDPDDAFIEIASFAAKGQGNSPSGDLDSDDSFRLLAPNSVFYLEINNVSQASYVKLSIIFALIPERGVEPPSGG